MGRKNFYFPGFILLSLIHVNNAFSVLFATKLRKKRVNYTTIYEKKTSMIEFDIILNGLVFCVLPKNTNFAS